MATNDYEIKDGYAVIFLNRADGTILETKVSLCDLDKVMDHPYKWRSHYYEHMKTYYCTAHTYNSLGQRRLQPLHRLIMNNPKGMDVDHINHDTLDNRRDNLRVVTRSENAMNKKGARKGSKSGVRGISWDGRWGSWRVRVTENGKLKSIGHFKDLEEAKRCIEDYHKRR